MHIYRGDFEEDTDFMHKSA